jgi:hypothetical protein
MTDEHAPHHQIMVQLLANRDGILCPIRGGHRNVERWAPAVFQERVDMAKLGIKLQTPATDGAGRKRWQRTIGILVSQGFVARARSSTQTVRLKLTPRGEHEVSGWTASYCLSDAEPWGLLTKLAAIADSGYGHNGGPCVNEQLLRPSDVPEFTRKIAVRIENQFLPALAAGFADSHYDFHGVVAYSITPSGRDALANRPKTLPAGKYNEPLADLYSELFGEALEAREKLTGNPAHVVIPLSAGLWRARTLEAIK